MTFSSNELDKFMDFVSWISLPALYLNQNNLLAASVMFHTNYSTNTFAVPCVYHGLSESWFRLANFLHCT